MPDSTDLINFLFRMAILWFAWWLGGQREPPEPPDDDSDDEDGTGVFLLRAAG